MRSFQLGLVFRIFFKGGILKIRAEKEKDYLILSIEDNGRGMPVDMHPVYKKSAMEIALTKLHAGGKFDKDSYQISGGLHGVGVSCVNALSKKMIAIVYKDGCAYQQEYKIGVPLYDVKVVGKCDKCNGELVQRADDVESVIRERLKVYSVQTSPLLNYYSKRGILRNIVGVGLPEDVTKRIDLALKD